MKFTLNNKEVELTAEEVQEIVEQSNHIKETEKKKIEIRNRWTGTIIYSSSKTTLKEAVEEANLYEANLSGADLSGADLSGADLYEANLSRADLSGADLYEANLYGAYLSEANLYGANLYGANLYGAYLYGAYLYGANLSVADLLNVKFFGKGGKTKIKKSQVDDFFKALGIIVED